MKRLIELGAVRIGAAIQNICTNVDFDVLSLPGGSLIAIVLWIYSSASTRDAFQVLKRVPLTTQVKSSQSDRGSSPWSRP
jgi:hypothetical protein